jgi:glycosyltransferase involved in cell wall biosynthesis
MAVGNSIMLYGMRVLAIIATYNEERFIGGCLEHLFAQGVEAYLCDNQSTDGTVAIASRYLGSGLRGIEEIPRDGTFRWRQILHRKEALASELAADWFLHLDPDEVPLPPRSGQTLAEALAEVDASGYNVVDFAELTFVPTREAPDHDHPDFRRTMRWYYPFAPTALHRVIAWKRQAHPVDLATTGGHVVRFPDWRLNPRLFRLCHYLFLSREHAALKYVGKTYDPYELRDGWHGWRSTLTADAIRLPSQADLRTTYTDDDLDASSPRTTHCLLWEDSPWRSPFTLHSAEPLRRPVVLCVVNCPNWAHDRKTDALARALSGSYEIVKRYQAEVSAADFESADCVLLYFWLQVGQMNQPGEVLRKLRDRLVMGICSHHELSGAWREPGLATLAELARAVFVNNRLLLEEFGPLLSQPVYYTPNGVDTEFFRPAVSPSPPAPTRALRVGWAGSLTNHGAEHRGVHQYIAPAVMAVEGAELCLAAREQTWRNQEEMLEFYRSLDVYVCASPSEGTPNPCLEAAACGLPVVTTRVGNMPELIRDGENGFFVERDAADIAEKLRRLRDDPELRERLGRAARATVVESWDWQRQAARYDEMLRAVTSKKPASPRPAG